MVEAVAFYCDPGTHSYRSFRPLTALHAAHILCENKRDSLEEITPKFDMEYLRKIRTAESIPAWYEMFHHLKGENESETEDHLLQEENQEVLV
jgi:hypothetical protein